MISVLLPSRGRPDDLEDSIRSLMDLADDPREVEILVGIDPDDRLVRARVQSLSFEFGHCNVFGWEAPFRHGYKQIHQYFNFLAGEATGEWLMLWNDDARMETEGWDTIIHHAQEVPGGPQHVLFMNAIYESVGERGNIFPVWPSHWRAELGYVSRSPNVDVWVNELGEQLGRVKRIPVIAVHHRRRGPDGDDTHKEGRGLMGEGNDPGYDSAANRIERARAARILGGLHVKV